MMFHPSLSYWISAVVSVFLHEAAHLITAKALRVQVKRLGFNWRGPYIVRESGTPIENTLISLAGPGVNLLLCLLTFGTSPMFAMVNGFLAVFNLLPFIPSSDGQRIYRLWAHRTA